nr:Chain A, Uncharacterized protein [Vibrio parahaemolyticus M0605]3X0T_B Chain B, Uncharacterized protein [Vibrio parahaemolyticus M0605]
MSNNIKHETDYSHDWTVEPNGGVTEVDSKHTPIIPEVGRSVDIENTGRGELTIQYQWGAPFMAGGWKVAKSHVVQRDETYHLQRPDNAFYHQRIVVINNGASRGFCTIYYHLEHHHHHH